MLKSLDELTERALKLKQKRLVVVSAEDSNVLKAVLRVKKLGLIAPIFIGDKTLIKRHLEDLNIHDSNLTIWHEKSPSESAKRASKAIFENKADILMKGLISTKDLLKQVLHKEYKLIENNLVSHLALFESPNYHKLFALADAAMNIAPDLELKKAIILNSVAVLNKLGIEKPNVAILAAIADLNLKMQATIDARELQEMYRKGEIKNCVIEGPLALDNAISKQSAEHKSIKSSVSGNVDLLIVPDIQSGNILYKSLTYLGNARCASLLTGAKIPIILTSRTDSEETKFFSIILGVLASENQN